MLLFYTVVYLKVKKYDEWRRIRRGESQVVVGARSAIFAPLKILV